MRINHDHMVIWRAIDILSIMEDRNITVRNIQASRKKSIRKYGPTGSRGKGWTLSGHR